MKRSFFITVYYLLFSTAIQAQSIPKELWGTWRVHREIPTEMISCWSENEGKKLLGTQIEYSAEAFRWKNAVIRNPVAKFRMVTAEKFHEENSSPSSYGSQVDFHQLGIRTNEVEDISIQHPPAHVAQDTPEIPGDDVLIKDERTIIFSVCGVFFEAKRVQTPKQAHGPN